LKVYPRTDEIASPMHHCVIKRNKPSSCNGTMPATIREANKPTLCVAAGGIFAIFTKAL
jgi:hypothetical protein